ncbi:MAG: response regulator [Proteobacteria bacterium]|nr:response regulator [Pseudomonadota bacterium]
MAKGDEILIADANPRDRDGLKKLFETRGYVCTAVEDGSQARDLVVRKFFPAAVIDMDVDRPNGGVELARYVREVSEPTSIIITAGRRSFDGAVEALRLGAVDVVAKHRDAIPHLTASVQLAVERYRAADGDGALLTEVQQVLDEALKIMLDMGRRVYEGGSSASPAATTRPSILVIDHDQDFLRDLSQQFGDKPWEVSVELSGGSGLEKASTYPFQIIVARQELPDLPGPMLIKSVQMQQPRVLGLVYTSEGETGRIDRYEGGKVTKVERSFSGASHLLDKLGEVAGEFATLQQERKYIRSFRSHHGSFLKRYADLKARLDSLTQ